LRIGLYDWSWLALSRSHMAWMSPVVTKASFAC